MKRIISIIFLCLFVQQSYCQQGSAVSADNINLLLKGFQNPLTVATYDCKQSEITLRTNNGKVTGENGHFIIVPDSIGFAEIEICKKTSKGLKRIGVTRFRVKKFPDPVLELNRRTGGKLYCSIARVQVCPIATWTESYGVCAHAKITGFTIQIIRDNQLLLMRTIHNASSGVKFNDDPDVGKAIESLNPGDKLLFSGITAMMPDGIERHLQPAEFLITDKEE